MWDRNIELREALVKLARQKPRYGYRRLHVLLQRRGPEVNVKRVFRLHSEEGLAVRRRKRKHLVRDRGRSIYYEVVQKLSGGNQQFWTSISPSLRVSESLLAFHSPVGKVDLRVLTMICSGSLGTASNCPCATDGAEVRRQYEGCTDEYLATSTATGLVFLISGAS